MKPKPEDKPPGIAPQKKKAPSPLWLNRRKSMFQFGYDPRDTANP